MRPNPDNTPGTPPGFPSPAVLGALLFGGGAELAAAKAAADLKVEAALGGKEAGGKLVSDIRYELHTRWGVPGTLHDIQRFAVEARKVLGPAKAATLLASAALHELLKKWLDEQQTVHARYAIDRVLKACADPRPGDGPVDHVEAGLWLRGKFCSCGRCYGNDISETHG